MRIGLISDTHLPSTGREPPSQVARAFSGVDLILHAGDIFSAECLDWLELIAPVIAVELSPAPVMGDPRVAERRVLDIEGYSVGLVHDLVITGMGGEVIPGMIGARFPPDRSLPAALKHAFGRSVDVVVFGHTHVAMVETHQGVLLVNPGSPTLPNQSRKLGTVGILEFTPGGPGARIVDLTGLGA